MQKFSFKISFQYYMYMYKHIQVYMHLIGLYHSICAKEICWIAIIYSVVMFFVL
jgi:hypothetical protein